MSDSNAIKAMSVDAISSLLSEKGIPERFCKAFKGK